MPERAIATEVIAPRLGVTVTEIMIEEWLIADGASVAKGDPLVVISTDKVNHELPAPASGIVRHRIALGDRCRVGDVIAEIG
jgi:pyruvate/2-oxoglutarate dehydrogenase complex dihydrolipoamide acyltransferase (E2) component